MSQSKIVQGMHHTCFEMQKQFAQEEGEGKSTELLYFMGYLIDTWTEFG